MKKFVIMTLAAVIGLGSANAQKTVLAGTKFRDNWSIGINGGILTPFNHSAFFKNSRATVGVDLNKQLSPVYGMTLENMWSINMPKTNATFDASNLMLLHRLNLNNLFARYKGKPCVFEVEAVGGFGWLHVNDAYTEDGKDIDGNWVSSKAGLNLNFNVGSKRAWTIGIKPAIVWNMTLSGQDHLNYNANQALWEVTAGITYRFKNSNGEHYMTRVRTYDAAEVNALNATINNLRQESADKDNTVKSLQDALRKQEQKSADLEKALRDCQNKAPQVVTKNQNTLESVVTFRQGKTVIDASQQPNVERIAVYLKNHKNATVNINGYASPEGNVDLNIKLANQRAEAVKTMLVNKYKIDASRITAKGLGVGDLFEEPDWNRVSICTIENNK